MGVPCSSSETTLRARSICRIVMWVNPVAREKRYCRKRTDVSGVCPRIAASTTRIAHEDPLTDKPVDEHAGVLEGRRFPRGDVQPEGTARRLGKGRILPV